MNEILLSVESSSCHSRKKTKITSTIEKKRLSWEKIALEEIGNDWCNVRKVNFPLINQLNSSCSFLFQNHIFCVLTKDEELFINLIKHNFISTNYIQCSIFYLLCLLFRRINVYDVRRKQSMCQ